MKEIFEIFIIKHIMIRISKEEAIIYKRAMQYASLSNIFAVLFWNYFRPKRMEKFHDMIINGVTWHAAYHIAKRSKI